MYICLYVHMSAKGGFQQYDFQPAGMLLISKQM